MSLNNFDYAPEVFRSSSSDMDRMLMENGEDDLDVPKELSIDNIRGMKGSIEKNVKDLKEALTEVSASQEENNVELISELNLALEQSNLLLEKIVSIEDGYKRAIKTDTILSKDTIDLAEQLGFIVPLHLTKTMEEISESVSPTNNVVEDTGLEVRESDYNFVSFDELEKYLNEPLLSEEKLSTPKDKTPQKAALTPKSNSTSNNSPSLKNSTKEPEPVTPNTSKEMRKEYLKNSISISKVSFSSPTSTASFFSTPAVEKSDRKSLEGDDYIEITPIVEEEDPILTEEQQQLIEEQDVDNLLEQLMIYTNGLEESKKSPRNRPISELIDDIKDEESTSQENISSPSIFLRHEGNSSPQYTRVTPRDVPIETHRETPREAPRDSYRVAQSPPKLSTANLENEFMKRDLEDAKNQIAQMKNLVESLQSKVNSTEAENMDLKRTIGSLYQAKNQFDIEMQSIKEKEEKINLIASSLGDHIEFLQGMVDKLKNERDSKVIKQSEQLTTIIETLIRKENTLLKSLVNQMESEMNNRKVVLDEEMMKLKKLVVECLGDDDENSKEISSDVFQNLQSELQTVSDELNEVNYFPSDPEDDIDIAVTRTLESLECPVTIEIERIDYGEYYLDRKLYIKLGPNGEPLVKNGNSFITLTSYVKRLYAPFFTTEKHLKEEEKQEMETQALQSSKFESLLQKLSKTRDYINNLHATPRSGSDSPTSSPRTSPIKNSTTLNMSQLNNSNESSNASSTKNSPREGPRLSGQRKDHIQEEGKEGRPSSAPPNTRYINILQRAEKNKKLKPIKPTPQIRRPPPNSMTYDRRNSPLPPNYVMHNNNLLFVKQPSHYEQVLAAHQSVKKPAQKPTSTNNSRPSSPRNQPAQQQQQQTIKSNLFGSIDLSDPKQLEKLKKQALRMQIQQFSQKPIH